MGISYKEMMSMDWEELLALGVNKSTSNGITLSIFKRVTKNIFKVFNFGDGDLDEEDFWTHMFENWCTEILMWSDAYPINQGTLLEWAEDYEKTFDNA